MPRRSLKSTMRRVVWDETDLVGALILGLILMLVAVGPFVFAVLWSVCPS